LKNVEPGTGHAVVHFWLCAGCSKVYTLEYREKSGTAVLRSKHPPAKAHKAKAREDSGRDRDGGGRDLAGAAKASAA
jgi:hypothetical protein